MFLLQKGAFDGEFLQLEREKRGAGAEVELMTRDGVERGRESGVT